MTHLFTYGLLQYQEVLEALVQKSFEQKRVTLTGYQRLTLQHKNYGPVAVAVESEGHSIHGVMLMNVDDVSLRIIDGFECLSDGLYLRQPHLVTDVDGDTYEIEAYVRGPLIQSAHLTTEWDETTFVQNSFQYYIDTVIPDYLRQI